MAHILAEAEAQVASLEARVALGAQVRVERVERQPKPATNPVCYTPLPASPRCWRPRLTPHPPPPAQRGADARGDGGDTGVATYTELKQQLATAQVRHVDGG
jgi:hypothetical protein